MAEKLTAPRGTEDVLPDNTGRWQYAEGILRRTARDFGFQEIRFPTFEHTELFLRGIGDTTDVVQKEMNTFADKAGRSITLRPEGTASVVRALVEHSLDKQGLPVKVYYIAPNFRYEKPQAGRYREHHQFGVECFGADSPAADAEVIALADTYLKRLGITGVTLLVNSIGCRTCRPAYHAALLAYFEQHADKLCPTCLDRMRRNPLRILDCKSPVCGEVVRDAPVYTSFLCEGCTAHHSALKEHLDAMGIAYQDAPRLVRGLDYYTNTVFEFVSDALGAQSAVCAGGRYNHLVEELGGPPLPGLGFGSGIERLLLVMEAKGVSFPPQRECELFLCAAGEAAAKRVSVLCHALRQRGVAASFDLLGRSVKAQMKTADRQKARFTMVVGDDELCIGTGKLKDMDSGLIQDVALDEESLSRAISCAPDGQDKGEF